MSLFNKDQFDLINEQALDDFLKRHESPMITGIDTAKSGGDYSVTKHIGWLVLRRIEKEDGTAFIAPSLLDTKHDADVFASCFDSVVAIMPIEWEE